MLLIAKENVHGLKATLLKCITTVCIFVNFNLPCMSAFCDVMIIHEVVVVFFFLPKDYSCTFIVAISFSN